MREDEARSGLGRGHSELEALLSSMEQVSRKHGRVLARDLARALTIIEELQHCPPGEALLLIKCCGEVLVDVDSSRRSQLVQRCLTLLENVQGSKLDISHYNALLKVGSFSYKFSNNYLCLSGSSRKSD